MSATATLTRVHAVQDLRRSNAAQPIPARKARRASTRQASRKAAIRDSY